MNKLRAATTLVFCFGIAGALLCRFLFGTPVETEETPDPNAAAAAEALAAEVAAAAAKVVPSGRTGPIRREVILMGSSFVFVVDAPASEAIRAIDAATKRLRTLEAEVSSWRPESDVTRLAGRAGIEPLAVGKDTFALLKLAHEIHAETDGAFDVTIGPVWDLWPFRNPDAALPTDAQVAEALKFVDASKIELDEARQTAYLPMPGMKVNLGAIGKGYAARIAVETMVTLGIKRAAVSSGGDIFLLGRKASGPWVVAIDHPRWSARSIERFVAGDVAVATSGDSQRYFLRGNKIFGHILDPTTGAPADECQSVTVITEDPARADAYATAIFVKGPKQGMQWVEQHEGVEALIVDALGLVTRSSGWSKAAPSAPSQSAPSVSQALKPSPKRVAHDRSTPLSELGQPAGRAVDEDSGELLGVPAGSFRSCDEKTLRELAAFRIDRTEVTNAQYQRFLDATKDNPREFSHPDEPPGKDRTPRYWKEYRSPLFLSTPAANLAEFDENTFRHPDHPVVGVDWWDAYAFARWAGKRLPTHHEHEKAARGDDGRIWPWGDLWDRKKVNGGGEKWGERDGSLYAAPAVSFESGVSVHGCLNIVGNVAEWTQEGFVAGGSSNSNPSQLRCCAAKLRRPGFRSFDIGFRCAADPAPPKPDVSKPEAKKPEPAKPEPAKPDATKPEPKQSAEKSPPPK